MNSYDDSNEKKRQIPRAKTLGLIAISSFIVTGVFAATGGNTKSTEYPTQPLADQPQAVLYVPQSD